MNILHPVRNLTMVPEMLNNMHAAIAEQALPNKKRNSTTNTLAHWVGNALLLY